ncbi:hypothetical protein C8R44DRAFT_741203 [Mycena epipterygia]|nr:hypothetical protein C8R44DRAFT_741203 [Mycena epipterygia]
MCGPTSPLGGTGGAGGPSQSQGGNGGPGQGPQLTTQQASKFDVYGGTGGAGGNGNVRGGDGGVVHPFQFLSKTSATRFSWPQDPLDCCAYVLGVNIRYYIRISLIMGSPKSTTGNSVGNIFCLAGADCDDSKNLLVDVRAYINVRICHAAHQTDIVPAKRQLLLVAASLVLNPGALDALSAVPASPCTQRIEPKLGVATRPTADNHYIRLSILPWGPHYEPDPCSGGHLLFIALLRAPRFSVIVLNLDGDNV